MRLIYPPTLFCGAQIDRKAKFLLTYEKGHQGLNPGGHCFHFLNTSINKKPIFVLEVVIFGKVITVIIITSEAIVGVNIRDKI